MRSRLVAPLVLLVALAPAVYFAVRWQKAESRLRETQGWTAFLLDSLGKSVSFPRTPDGPWGRDSVYWQWTATMAQLQSRRWQQAVRYWVERRATLLDLADIAELERQGLQDPAKQLRDSLAAHPEIIPYPGVMGGTMFFLPDQGIVLLAPPYVFARFEDGHIGGSMLLEYTILPGPRIEWKRLWARKD
jgi:hypothetical protein